MFAFAVTLSPPHHVLLLAFSSFAKDKNRRTNKLLHSIEEKRLKQKMDQAAEDKTLKEMRKLNRKIDKLQITNHC